MKKSRGLKESLGEDAFLYVHYPFCSNLCNFCIYKIHKYAKNDSDSFLKYYDKEIELYTKELSPFKFKNIHIGGGTPNLIEPSLLLEPLRKLVDFNQVKRFVVEVFPRKDLKEYLEKLKDYNVSKIQLGIQTLNEDILNNENRVVSKKTILDCMEVLSKSGILWSVDLMYGFMGEQDGNRDFISELKEILGYKPSGFHLYPIRSESENLFYGKEKKDHKALKFIDGIEIYTKISDILVKEGYKRVRDELCVGPNIAHAEKTICYNKETGAYPDVVGIGPGAVGHTRVIQYRNVKDLGVYSSLLDKGVFPIKKDFDFSSTNLYPLFSLLMGLRMSCEFDIGKFLSSNKVSDKEKEEIDSLLSYLKNKEINYKIENGKITIPKSKYTSTLFLIEEYISLKNK